MIHTRLASLGVALALTACGGGVGAPKTPNEQRNPGDAVAHLAVPFTLAVGHSATVSGTPLRLTFVAVRADSRCPMGVMCIRAGDATVEIATTVSGRDSTLSLKTASATTPTTPDPTTGTTGAYAISFSELTPRPGPGRDLEQKDYSAQFVVTAR